MAEPIDGYGIRITVDIRAEPFYRHAEESSAGVWGWIAADDLTADDLDARHEKAKAAAQRAIVEIQNIYTNKE